MISIKYFPDKEAGGIKGWNWIDSDSGAWDGPKMDWESHHHPNIKMFVQKFRTAIQAGGNQGMYSRLLSRMFERVYTFEPDELNFKTLVSNSDQGNIYKTQAALGNENGFCDLQRPTMMNTGMHRISTTSQGDIPLIKLDNFISRSDVDLIMLDLEEFEHNALIGMNNLINASRPVIFIERPSQAVLKFMEDINYRRLANSSMDVIFIG